jgi:V-type H+-transporting ATPase subunit D
MVAEYLSHVVVQNVDKANLKIRSAKENVAGVQLPVFEPYTEGPTGTLLPAARLTLPGFELTGLAKGGQKIRQCAEAWTKAVKLLVELASLQVLFLLRHRLLNLC